MGDILSKAGTAFQVFVPHGLEQVCNATSGKKCRSVTNVFRFKETTKYIINGQDLNNRYIVALAWDFELAFRPEIQIRIVFKFEFCERNKKKSVGRNG